MPLLTHEWYSKPLQAFTLEGMATVNVRALTSNVSSLASLRCEITRVDGDGTNPTVWGSWCMASIDTTGVGLTTTQAARAINVSGDSLAFTDGQRIRIRLYLDDMASTAMVNGFNVQAFYNGTSAAASGDTYITLPVTVTEFSSGPVASLLLPNRNLMITRR